MIILILSDAHSNIGALKHIFDTVQHYDYVIFLGDFVDYGPWPDETISYLKENVDIALQGNHDFALSYGKDCGCGEENHDVSVYTREVISQMQTSDENLNYLRSLKPYGTVKLEGKIYELFHGSPGDPLYRYATEKTISGIDTKKLSKFGVTDLESTTVFVGHTHIPMDYNYKGIRFINPGSAGSLCRDLFGSSSIALYDTENESVSFHRIKMDNGEVIKTLKNIVKDNNIMKKLERMYGF